MIQILMSHQAAVYLGLFLVSEILADIPSIQANSIFQFARSFIKPKAKAAAADIASKE